MRQWLSIAAASLIACSAWANPRVMRLYYGNIHAAADQYYRVSMTVSNSFIDATLTNWTVVFDQSFDSVLTSTNGPLDLDGSKASLDGGGDVRFSSDAAGATRLACDIRTWAPSNDPANATCEVAVNIPTVSSNADTTIYMWWGKAGESQPAATNAYGQYNAYDEHYIFVLPLLEALPGAASSIKDRTSNQNHFTPNALDSVDRVAAKIGTGYKTDGTPEMVYSTDDSMIDWTSAHTHEVIIRPPSGSSLYHYFFQQRGAGNGGQCYVASSLVRYWDGKTVWNPGYGLTQDAWNHVVWVNDGDAELFVGGTSRATSSAIDFGGASTADIEFQTDTSTYAKGRFDEARWSDMARPAAWIKANYNNQFNVSGFLNWGSIETASTSVYDD